MLKKRALVFVDGLFNKTNGKTAHGLVRYSKRFEIACVVDSTLYMGDAGEILDGVKRNIPLYTDLRKAYKETGPDTFIIGAVSEGGTLPEGYDKAITWALKKKLNIISGLHQFISDEPLFIKLAKKYNCSIIDVRKIFRDHKRFYSGNIKNVLSTRIAILGTDSAIGKRTIAVLINEELKKRGRITDMIYTGQTGWMQGWPHGVVFDAMINDFVAGGIEGAILDSWKDLKPDFMVIEGQGSLIHPFFPGGYEILIAGKVHGFILVDAPGRPHLDGFQEYPMPNPQKIVDIAQLLTETKLLGIAINPEELNKQEIKKCKKNLIKKFNVPVIEPLSEGVSDLVDILEDLRET